eukprot:TRINITY_DN66105_c0_g1_i1.p1 TRINITY_DN66105_c0_g1~~TRINITY_DN66105_c0_g1_i1.p1  ORF type:complete len:395 (+),score=107.43 TRINITY_DN66105_c0_g1_i1:46-1185(+)
MDTATSFLESTTERADLNQYWFSPATVAAFVAEICDAGGSAALVSSPSVFFSLPEEVRQRSKVLDFDRQWESDPGFVFYDFNEPENLPPDLRGSFDFVLIDPPFITREVWEKYAATARFLRRDGAKLLCTTIAESESMMFELLSVRPVLFRPSIPNLVYQYSIYLNYQSDRLRQLNPEIDDSDWRQEASSRAAGYAAEGSREERPIAAAGTWQSAEAEAPAEVPLPPDAALLMELRERLAAVKRALEAMQAPLQTAQRRKQAGGDAAAAALAKAEAAEMSARAALAGLEDWLQSNGPSAARALGECSADAPVEPRLESWTEKDRWHVRAVRDLLSAARNLSDGAAVQDWAQTCRRSSTALFRQSNQVLERIKHLKAAAP